MRHRFTNLEIFKAWVAGTSDWGKGDNTRFDGDRAYSYSQKIAQRFHNKRHPVDGYVTFLVQTGTFTNSTSRHLNLLKDAIDNCPSRNGQIIYIFAWRSFWDYDQPKPPNPSDRKELSWLNHELDIWETCIEHSFKKARRARTCRLLYLQSAQRDLENVIALLAWLEVPDYKANIFRPLEDKIQSALDAERGRK
jgi:hypothetical protein